MSFRVTQGMMNTQLLRNLSNNLARTSNSQNQLSTGRRINAPSDDPVGLSNSLRYRTESQATDQLESNVDSAISLLDYTDTVLDQTTTVVQRIRELTLQASNETNTQTSLNSINSEIDQLYKQLVVLGNSQFSGKYIFNGQLIDKAPYNEATASTDVTDTGKLNVQVGAGVVMPVNLTGKEVFGPADDPANPGTNKNLFTVVNTFKQALSTSDTSTMNTVLGDLDKQLDNLLLARADIGAKQNRADLAKSRLEDLQINVTKMQSTIEDADISTVFTNMAMDQNVYQASLSVGSKLIQTSLIDFLK